MRRVGIAALGGIVAALLVGTAWARVVNPALAEFVRLILPDGTEVDSANPLPTETQTASTVNEFNASVSASSFELTTENEDRKGLACCNTGLATVTLRMSTSDAVLDQSGDKIFPGACWWDEPPVWTGEINAIGDQADGAIYCTEKEL